MTIDSPGDDPPRAGVRGWLLLLCAWLALWQPINLAVAASDALMALPVRGWPLAVLLAVRLGATAAGIAAAHAIWNRQSGAPAFARAAILLSLAVQLWVYSTSIAPNNRVPGDTTYYVAAAIVVHASWLLYLMRSRRVMRTFD